jgi:hypothetical protein
MMQSVEAFAECSSYEQLKCNDEQYKMSVQAV